MVDLFERASRQRVRFDTVLGTLATEDLWNIPLKSISKVRNVSLDIIAIALNKAVKESGEESFVEDKTTVNKLLELKFDIVKHIIKVKLADNAKRTNTALRKAKKDQLLALIADKENDELKGKSKEDLLKMVKDL